MDDTVREIRKKEGRGCKGESFGSAPARGRKRARGHARAREHTSAAYVFAVTGTGLMRL